MPDLDISDLAKRSGVPASTLRYYEEQGLLRSIGRRGLRRVFAASAMDRLALIALGAAAGFSLAEIGRMIGGDGRPRIDRKALSAKAGEVDLAIQRLAATRDALRHAAACPAPSHLECPTFRRLMHAALAGALGEPRKALRRKPRVKRPGRGSS